MAEDVISEYNNRPVADIGFPVWGRQPLMSKWKNQSEQWGRPLDHDKNIGNIEDELFYELGCPNMTGQESRWLLLTI